MMIGKAGEKNEMLLLGLSHENISRLLGGQPIHLSRRTHGDAMPDDLEIFIIAGITEEAMAQQLREAGIVNDMTLIFKDKRMNK